MRISKVVDFAAAHSIADAGKCANKHGHNWEATIEVDLIAGDLDSRGFIADVAEIKQAAYKYDHDDLDKYFESASTENVCQKIADDVLEIILKGRYPDPGESPPAVTVRVHLQETKNNSADAVASNAVGELQKSYFREVGLKGSKHEDEDREGRNPGHDRIRLSS